MHKLNLSIRLESVEKLKSIKTKMVLRSCGLNATKALKRGVVVCSWIDAAPEILTPSRVCIFYPISRLLRLPFASRSPSCTRKLFGVSRDTTSCKTTIEVWNFRVQGHRCPDGILAPHSSISMSTQCLDADSGVQRVQKPNNQIARVRFGV